MNDEIKKQLHEIELALLKNTGLESIVSHFANVQLEFERLEVALQTIQMELTDKRGRVNSLEKSLNDSIHHAKSLESSLLVERERVTAMLEDAHVWKIERKYAEQMIATLKDLFSAALTRSALNSKGFLEFSGNLPAPMGGSSGYLTGKGGVETRDDLSKPTVR